MKIFENTDLSQFTLYRTGGSADYFCTVKKQEDFQRALKFSKNKKIPYFVIGGGSNILISDKGFRGLVIKNEHKDLTINGSEVLVSSGYNLQKMTGELAEVGLSGFEGLAGIPGTVGGAIVGNAGSFGNQISDFLTSVMVLDSIGNLIKLEKNDLHFDYRSSEFKKKQRIIVGATFYFEEGNSKEIKERIKKNLEKKWKRQPSGKTCGSFFRNPKGDFAGRVIEELGFKGRVLGGAEVSKKHSNFILNKNHSTSQDIYKLGMIIKKDAKERLKVKLEEEIIFVGEFDEH